MWLILKKMKETFLSENLHNPKFYFGPDELKWSRFKSDCTLKRSIFFTDIVNFQIKI